MTVSLESFKALDRLDLERVKAGEKVVIFISGDVQTVPATVVTHPVSGRIKLLMFYDDGSIGNLYTTDFGIDMWIRMAPKPKERLKAFLNVYSSRSVVAAHLTEMDADNAVARSIGAGRTRDGGAVTVHLVKGDDGNWHVDTGTDKGD